MPQDQFRGRVEDRRLLTGQGRFIDDLQPAGLAHACVYRSPHAHARLAALDSSAAAAAPGVLAILTDRDLARAGVGPLKAVGQVTGRDGRANVEPLRPVLAGTEVKYVGEPVAFVVAETPDQAADAAELIEADYRDLPVAVDPAAALEAGAAQLWPEAPGNLCFDWEAGDRAAVEAAFRAADHEVGLTVAHPRIVVSPLETRGALGSYDPETYLLYAPTQGVHRMRRLLAEEVLKVDEATLRVITPDVGGSFGAKIFLYPEYPLVLIASRRIGRPVKWIGSRSESFLTDAQGRARIDRARLALDRDGRMLALAIDAIGDLGAYLSTVGVFCPSEGAVKVLGQNYRIPAIHYRARGVFTNAAPTDAYRGAGKPESVATMECLIDAAAREIGIDRVALRRVNLVRPSDLPYRTPMEQLYDSGDFPAALDRALALSDWPGFAGRAAAARARGRIRGLGLGLYLHATGGNPAEVSRLSVRPDGGLLLATGSQSAGQGHETVLARIAADRLGIPAAQIEVLQGDSALIAPGGGTGGSSLLAIVGTTVTRAADALIERGREMAGQLLEAAPADIDYEAGLFRIVGTDRTLPLAALTPDTAELSGEFEDGCTGEATFEGVQTTFPNGAYVAEVEIDAETGALSLVAFAGIDDLGTLIVPALAIGQLHGGLAQGIGAALMEQAAYDPDSGQLPSGSFMDYRLPRAGDLPGFRLAQLAIANPSNSLGIKGAGEVSTIGAPGAVMNAVNHALASVGAEAVQMPATAERVWRALRDAGKARSGTR